MRRRAAWTTLAATLIVAWGLILGTQLAGISPKLGLDLQGGFSVLLEAPEGTDPAVLDTAIEIIRRRIEALGGVQEPEISLAGERNIEVQLPGVTDQERARKAVGTTGQLTFRPVISTTYSFSPDGLSPLYVEAEAEAEAEAAAAEAAEAAEGEETTTTDEATTTTEQITTTTEETTTTTVEPEPVDLTPVLPEGIALCELAEAADGTLIVPLEEQPGCVDPATGFTLSDDPEKDAWYLNPEPDENGGYEAFHLGPADLLGTDLSDAQAGFSTRGGSGGFGVSSAGTGQWAVYLSFSSGGASKFEEATKELSYYPYGDDRRRFAIVLDGEVVSAPSLSNEIPAGEGIVGQAIITVGSADNPQQEAYDLAVVLRYGSLPVALEEQSVLSVSATLGSDSLRAGLVAGVGGLVLVALAMVLYYRALGLVNVLGLTVFGSIVISVYALLGETQGVSLTLAGVAGVVVAIGITSDSYIVYFERIKEDIHRGRSVRMAIEHAFRRSFRTIITADTVSFFGAVLLYLLAIGSVKGFALALGIATVTDVVVFYFFTRPAVALVARSRFGEGGSLSIKGAAGRMTEEAL
jgi:preprotein translocase subunit SecD